MPATPADDDLPMPSSELPPIRNFFTCPWCHFLKPNALKRRDESSGEVVCGDCADDFGRPHRRA